MIDNLIYEINKAQSDSNINVIMSIVCEYNKYFTLSKYTDETTDMSIFQEAKTEDTKKGLMDRIKERGKDDDSKLITFLKFIPRLIIEMFRPLVDFFKNSKLGEKFKKINKDISDAKDKSEKEARVKKLNKMFDGKCECYYDEKSGKVKIKKTKAGFANDLIWIMELGYAALKFKQKWKSDVKQWESSKLINFFDDINLLLSGKDIGDGRLENTYNLFDDGLDAMSQVMSDISATTALLDSLARAIQSIIDKILRKEIIKDQPDEKKEEMLAKARELVSKISSVTTKINLVVIVLKPIKDWGGVIGEEVGGVVAVKQLHKEARIRLCQYILTDKKEGHYKDDVILTKTNDEKPSVKAMGEQITTYGFYGLNILKKVHRNENEPDDKYYRRVAEAMESHQYYPKECLYYKMINKSMGGQKIREVADTAYGKLQTAFNDMTKIYGIDGLSLETSEIYEEKFKEILDEVKNADHNKAKAARDARLGKNTSNNNGGN